jgi:uncharacterized membrane protein YphA (DoxX/SURF4 family)
MARSSGLWRQADDTGVPLLVARLILAAVFAYMGISKGLDPIEFLKQTREYHLLPETPPHLLNLTAVVLPWLEVACAVALLAGVWVRGASLTLFGMLVAFTAAVGWRAWSLYQAEDIAFCAIVFDCGCGAGPVKICSKLAENLSLIALSVVAMFSRSRRFCLTGLPPASEEPAPVAS